jgi:hypothetical protein
MGDMLNFGHMNIKLLEIMPSNIEGVTIRKIQVTGMYKLKTRLKITSVLTPDDKFYKRLKITMFFFNLQ